VVTVHAHTADDVWKILTGIPDPELPVLDIVELGIVRGVEIDGSGVRVAITPTFTACPAMRAIERDIAVALRAARFDPVAVHTVLAPPWTTDWMTDQARAKLKAYGIAPPGRARGDESAPWSTGTRVVACPRCDAVDTQRISEFGSTPCKALYRCNACQEPFEHFKCS
jgi:ring-1,2-phenylacetyl-CoA epoxidase subunit PaaD